MYYTFPAAGLDLVFDEGRVSAAHYYGPGSAEDVQPYAEPLPRGLAFSDSKRAVLQKLGTPAVQKNGIEDPRPFVRMNPWMKYRYDGYFLHVQFAMDESHIRLITLQG